MSIIIFIIIAIVLFFLWFFIDTVIKFIQYKKRESEDKDFIRNCLLQGLNFKEAIIASLRNIEERHNIKLNLSQDTIYQIGEKFSELNKTFIWDIENVIELYSTFVHRYIYREKREPSKKITDEQILYALNNMRFNEKNRYYVIAPDRGEDFDKKYPPK